MSAGETGPVRRANGSGDRRTQRSATLHAGGSCFLSCAACDCDIPPTPGEDVERTLARGCGRLVLRGATESSGETAGIVRRARAHGVPEIVLRTNAVACATPDGAAAFARFGADGVLVPVFSPVAAVHDRIAGRPGALSSALAGMRALERAGLWVEVETPLLPVRLQPLEALVDLLRRAVDLRALRFFLPGRPVPPPIAPPSWAEGGPRLAAALVLCRARGVQVALGAAENVPLCALADFPDLHDVYRFDPRKPAPLPHGNGKPEACGSCAARAQCPGVARSYSAAHGAAGLLPYARRPALMYQQRTTRRREWTDRQRRSAATNELVVLRPTVNCNQDCPFCSANETSGNQWSDRKEMLRQIARAARRGAKWLCFSGGEPTLSKDLPAYVRAGKRLGFPRVEVVTNGVLLDARAKVAALREAGLTDAFVSLHAHDEALSRHATQKVGDFPRTVRAIHNFLDEGIRVVLNHVVTSRNTPYLPHYVEFVNREFGGRPRISFAFVSPQFKVLEQLDLVPRLGDVTPPLKRAMYRALDLGQPFVVGSRQGIPPCFLGEFAAWSDVLHVVDSAFSEDEPQKQRAPACDRCCFTKVCVGLWKTYVARFGVDEVRPVEGPPFTDAELSTLRAAFGRMPAFTPRSFDEVPPLLRMGGPPPGSGAPEAAREEPALPDFVPVRSRPLRLAMIGSGRQARRLALAALDVPGIAIEALASPHAPDGDTSVFGGCPVYRDAAEALDDVRPEGVIVAAVTEVHLALARLAVARGIPVLLEKPATSSEAEGETLRDEAARSGVPIVPAHNVLFATGVEQVLAGSGPLAHLRRRAPSAEDSPRAWSRRALFDILYHALVLVGRGAGGGAATVTAVSFRGDGAPRRIRLELRYPRDAAELVLDFEAQAEEDTITRTLATGGTAVWQRRGRVATLATPDGTRTLSPEGSEASRMLASFRDVVLGRSTPSATLEESIDVRRTVRHAIEALEGAGAPFDRAGAPRHVASRPAGSGPAAPA